MEQKILSVTYKNSYRDIYEANYTYASVKGKLSKKFFFGMLIPSFLLCSVSIVMVFIEENLTFGEDNLFFAVSLLIVVAGITVLYLIIRAIGKMQIKTVSRFLSEGFNAENPRRADFYEDRVIIQSGYSTVSIPYEEFDYVISDRLNFIFSFGGDLNIRNIPKTNQNPDELFILDGIFGKKLGEKFIYKM